MRVAIMGAGGIAVKMANTLKGLEDVETYAVASRSLEKAEAFANKNGFTKAYGSYEEMLKDDAVDLVYVATPHSHHFQCVKLCLEHGKHVLCEKSFTVNAGQAEELFNMAKEKNLLLTEAIWTRYMPSRKLIDDLIAEGAIGEVTSLEANLGYELSAVPRMLDPKLAGGALLDLGVYLVHFARMVFGSNMKQVIADAVMLDTGVDAEDSITMVFEGGKMAVTHCNMRAVLNRRGTIFGTKGYIEIQNLNNPEKISVYDAEHHLVKEAEIPEQITGYEYEVLACKKAIESGQIECPEIPHKETIAVMKILDEIRTSWNYKIPGVE